MAYLHFMIDSENVYTYHPLSTVGIGCLDAHLKVSQLSWTLMTNNQCTVEKYVLVITSLRGMLPVYRPVTRGRVAPEGGGPINRNLPIRDVIIDL